MCPQGGAICATMPASVPSRPPAINMTMPSRVSPIHATAGTWIEQTTPSRAASARAVRASMAAGCSRYRAAARAGSADLLGAGAGNWSRARGRSCRDACGSYPRPARRARGRASSAQDRHHAAESRHAHTVVHTHAHAAAQLDLDQPRPPWLRQPRRWRLRYRRRLGWCGRNPDREEMCRGTARGLSYGDPAPAIDQARTNPISTGYLLDAGVRLNSVRHHHRSKARVMRAASLANDLNPTSCLAICGCHMLASVSVPAGGGDSSAPRGVGRRCSWGGHRARRLRWSCNASPRAERKPDDRGEIAAY